MKRIATFWSDPHLGLDRKSHTTPASRKKLKDSLFEAALEVTKDTAQVKSYCLGDLFDTDSNEEDVILQGAHIFNRCEAVLAGNHDSPNRAGLLSSLELIGQLTGAAPGGLISGDSSTHFSASLLTNTAKVWAVPHKLTQELFEQTLEEARKSAQPYRDLRLLLLHCNYDSTFATNESELNLARSLAEDLLETFDAILIGHEHVARSDFDGRLQVLGNIHPTSFSDISDKFVWDLFEGDKGPELLPRKVWSKECSASIDWGTLLSGPTRDWSNLQFIDVTGTAPAARMSEIAKAVSDLWDKAPDALMIRNSVKAEELVLATPAEAVQALNIPEKVSSELFGTDLFELWQHYRHAAEGA